MLVELSVVEQRYHAVMEVLSAGAPVVEVAARYGVSRKTVHAWVRRYRDEGLPGLSDRSHRPHHHPWQLAADVEARICELRRAHPRWGPRRLGHELDRAGVSPVPSRSSIYRTLVRQNLITPKARKRPRSDYVRWERSESMALWQLDIMGSVMIADDTTATGTREVKLITGIDDHSRYLVLAAVVAHPTSRAVCRAFLAALAEFGVPEQVLTDNGMQFTGAYVHPKRSEVLFERICRRNGIDHLRTKIRSPTTTGKIERFHQSIQVELLDPHLAEHGPFGDIAAAQAAVDTWVHDYNHTRPHQARDMDPPAVHFVPVPACERADLPLWAPPELTGVPTPTPPGQPTEQPTEALTEALPAPAALVPTVDLRPPPAHRDLDALAPVELDRVVPASGNLAVAGQQFWLGTQRAGRTVRFWIDTTTVHLAVDGVYLKTLPSRITTTGLARLRADGARPAGPPPARPAATERDPVEVHRTVNRSGNVSLAGQYVPVGAQHAGQRVIIRFDNDLAQVILDDTIVRTRPLVLSRAQRHRLRAAQIAAPRPAAAIEPERTQRRVSAHGETQVIGQRVPVGRRYAGRLVTIEIGETTLFVFDETGTILLNQIPRTSTKTLARHKPYGVSRNRTTG
jgi:transposase InsO family protein